MQVMLVEDDTQLNDSLTDYLTSRGIRVLSADTGQAALELLDAGNRPDFILLDAHLKDMNADRFLSQFRKTGARVAVTSGDPNAFRWARAHGISFLPKPMPLAALDAMIDDAQSRRERAQ